MMREIELKWANLPDRRIRNTPRRDLSIYKMMRESRLKFISPRDSCIGNTAKKSVLLNDEIN